MKAYLNLGLLLVGLFSQNVFAGIPEGLPQGNFIGEGLWRDTTQQGGYRVETHLSGDRIETIYNIGANDEKKYTMIFAPSENGFFTVKVENEEIGKGYCLKQAQVCHYEIKVGELKLEETLTFLDGKLYRFGSKERSGHYVMWQEEQESVVAENDQGAH